MNMTRAKEFPPGWDEERVQRLIRHYESQTEEEAIAEDEAARENGLSDLPELYAELGLPPPDAPAKAAG